MAKRNLKAKRTIITGASSGIGRAIALELARHQARLVLVARRQSRLDDLAEEIKQLGAPVEIVVGDITDPEVRKAAVEKCVITFGGLDIVVNNAGVGAMGLFEDADPDRLRRVMEVNFFALVELTREALPHLKEGDDALIVNISSVLGKRAAPHSSEYSASKFAVEGFSQSLRAEVAKHGIGVLVVCPGTTETEFFDVVIERTSQPNWPEHKAVPAEEVARQTIRAMRCRRSEITPYFWGRMMCLLNRISPSLVDRMMRRYA